MERAGNSEELAHLLTALRQAHRLITDLADADAQIARRIAHLERLQEANGCKCAAHRG